MKVGQIERKTQDRIIELFQNELHYTYLGDWEERENHNIEREFLEKYLKDKYEKSLIDRAVSQLEKISTNQTKNLYELNREIYEALRYGISVKENISDKKQTVQFINWREPEKNHFYVAEEVTIVGKNTKRPDVVLYVNGIALAVLELKRSKVSVTEGIRQNLDNQRPEFIRNFFGTIQLVMAGNDSEGLRYGVIETPEKYYLRWKENDARYKLDHDLSILCEKKRFLEIIHDFIVFDGGVKKIARHNQYFAVKATQEKLQKREGGIIWHTQGSGKTLTMVWIAKWIRENIDDSRVLIITDRKELDDQIETRFFGVNEQIHRTKSGRDTIEQLDKSEPWLICSLIHKFKRTQESEEDDFGEIFSKIPKTFKAKGDIYVFVDECHRTQSGKLHDAMKTILPSAVFVGFSGTPLLQKDKKTTLEIFGGYIHTYKYDEAVRDKVILDLHYEAREIEQKLSSKDKVDQWFEAKTSGLTDFAKTELKKKWATMQKVLSSDSRLEKIAGDIMLDIETKPRLSTGKGNALLIAGSIYEACKYWEIFSAQGLKKCAIVTSYNAHVSSIKGETVSLDEDTDNITKYETYQKMLEFFKGEYPDIKDVESFEKLIKEKFVKEPDQMKLLIVVDKLLTGFDAPPATYLYIDKSMRDHGLFQAICRVNRLDGDDKDYGYIIDYKDLFKSLEKSVTDYTEEALGGFEKSDVNGLLKDRIVLAREKLDTSLENIRQLCEPVKPPKETPDFIEFFAPQDNLLDTEQRRIALYKMTSSLVVAYSNIANEMSIAGFSKSEALHIKEEVARYLDVRQEIKLASGDYIDLKAYEPAMRHLLDTYISAEESEKISTFDDLTIVEMVITRGVDNTIKKLPESIQKNNDTVAEVIENNVRRVITEEKPTNPKYYEKISQLLKELIEQRKKKVIEYEKYLEKISELCRQVKQSNTSDYPPSINTFGKRSLYDNLDRREDMALAVDKTVNETKADGWRESTIKEKTVKIAVKKILEEFDEEKINLIFEIIKEPRNGY